MLRPGLLLAALIATTGLPAAAQEVVKIGDINSYTRMAAFTEPYRMGLEMAVGEINAGGGIGGRTVEIVSRDDAGEPGEAIKIAEEMLTREGVAFITGGYFSNVGLALASFAKQRQTLYLAGEPLADALVWQEGNRYTFRLRPSTWMQAAMLAEVAAKRDATRWATIAPNYAYGKEAVEAFKAIMSARRPEIEWVAEQWPPLFGIDAGAEIQALTRADPDALFNVTFGTDLARFVREGEDRGFFEGRFVASQLTGEPEYLDPLGAETPEGWLVTGYPWAAIDTPAHKAFLEAYEAAYGTYPRLGSVVGYNVGLTIKALLERTGGKTDTETLLAAMEDLTFDSPIGTVRYRASDHQSTMGAFVGFSTVENGTGTMRDWYYADGEDYLPPEDEAKAMRPPE